jgi:hypothetical protein
MQAGQAWGREIAQKVLNDYEKSQRQATPPPQDNLLD